TVIAAGGGVVTRPENRRLIAAASLVAWLTARVDTILARLAADETTSARRPNLLGGGEAEIRRLLAERAPLYGDCAALQLATDDRSPAEVADELLSRFRSTRSGPEGE